MNHVANSSSLTVSRPAATEPVRIYWPYAINVLVVHGLATFALVPWFFSWTGVALCLAGLYVYGTLGINLCFHRLLTHQSFVVPKWLERSLATIAICCARASP